MKTLILHGVPYNVNDMNEIFLYTKLNTSGSSNAASSVHSPQIGTYDPTTQKLTFFPDWEMRSAEFVTNYRKMLQQESAEALEKARILQTS